MESAHKATPAQLSHQVVTRQVSRQAEVRLQLTRPEPQPAKAPKKSSSRGSVQLGEFLVNGVAPLVPAVRCETGCTFHRRVGPTEKLPGKLHKREGSETSGFFCSPEDGMYLQLDSMCKDCIQGRIGRRGSH